MYFSFFIDSVEEHKAFQVVVTQYVWIGLMAGLCLVSKSPLKARHKQETGALVKVSGCHSQQEVQHLQSLASERQFQTLHAGTARMDLVPDNWN